MCVCVCVYKQNSIISPRISHKMVVGELMKFFIYLNLVLE